MRCQLKANTITTVLQSSPRKGDKYLLFVLEQYQRTHNTDAVDLDDVVKWALDELKLDVEPISREQLLKRKLARAMGNEYITDPQKREVRKFHPVRRTEDGRTWTVWAPLTTADPGHMRMSLQQHRQYILGNCRQHKLVFDSYNDNNKFQAKLPGFDYNFNPDLEELALPTEYPNERPGDEEN